MYTIKLQVIDENGTEILSTEEGPTPREKLFAPGAKTPGPLLVARHLVQQLEAL